MPWPPQGVLPRCVSLPAFLHVRAEQLSSTTMSAWHLNRPHASRSLCPCRSPLESVPPLPLLNSSPMQSEGMTAALPGHTSCTYPPCPDSQHRHHLHLAHPAQQNPLAQQSPALSRKMRSWQQRDPVPAGPRTSPSRVQHRVQTHHAPSSRHQQHASHAAQAAHPDQRPGLHLRSAPAAAGQAHKAGFAGAGSPARARQSGPAQQGRIPAAWPGAPCLKPADAAPSPSSICIAGTWHCQSSSQTSLLHQHTAHLRLRSHIAEQIVQIVAWSCCE